MSKKVSEFLSFYPQEIRILVDEVSGSIFQTFPTIKEKVYTGWKGLGYIHSDAGYICGIFPTQEVVKLGFENGFAMTDKYNLFSEETKKVKYIVFKPGDYIDRKQIEEYLQEAVELKNR